jgi:hypothetical protein
MKNRLKRLLFHSPYSRSLVTIIVGLAFLATAAAVTTLNIPAITITGQAASTSSACSGNIVLANSPTPGSGTLRYYCSTSSGAFTVNTIGSDTPTFNPDSQITSVGYVAHSAGTCSGGFTALTSGSAAVLSSTGDFDVCATYSCPTGCSLAAWSFSWAT